MKTFVLTSCTLALVSLLSACGGGGGDAPASPPATVAAPTITAAPTATVVVEGQTATFSVVASGSGTLSYQWQLNGVDIAGATASTYTTSATNVADSGRSYSVKVSNAGGTTASAAAALTVNAAASTAGFQDTQATASDLAIEASAAIAAAERKALVPGAVELFGALPTGVLTTINCTNGGTITYDMPTSLGSGTTYTYQYNNCSYAAGYVFNGSYVMTYSRFTSATDFAWSIRYDFSYTGPNLNYSYAGTQTCTYGSSGYNCTYNDGTRSFGSTFSYSGGRLSGSYEWTYGSYGSATFSYSNWGATSGTATITGPNGFTATVVRNSATSFTVTINGGTPRTVTVG